MDEIELKFHLENLRECDPNYVVDVLGVTSEELVDTFYKKAVAFILEDQG